MTFAQNNVKRPDTYNYNRGLEELRNENYEEALNYLNKEVESDPKNGYAYSWIAMIRHSQEEYGRALTSVDLALKIFLKKMESLLLRHIILELVCISHWKTQSKL